MSFEKEIIREDEVLIRGKAYKQVTYDDGEKVLQRYNSKYQMWVTLRFRPDNFDDSEVIDNLKQITRDALINNYRGKL